MKQTVWAIVNKKDTFEYKANELTSVSTFRRGLKQQVRKGQKIIKVCEYIY